MNDMYWNGTEMTAEQKSDLLVSQRFALDPRYKKTRRWEK